MTILYRNFKTKETKRYQTSTTTLDNKVVAKILKVSMNLTEDQARARSALGILKGNAWDSDDGDFMVEMVVEE